MHTREVGDHHAADHHVVEVRDDEIGISYVDVDAKRGEEQSSQTTNRKQSNKTERIEHRRLVRNRALVHCGRPVKHFDRGGHADKIREEREDERSIERDPGYEHVVRPD